MRPYLLFFLLLLSANGALRANIAAPSSGGVRAGEPSGLETLSVRRERLSLDFRPVVEGAGTRAVFIEVEYNVESSVRGAATLIFLLGKGNANEFKFTVDGRAVDSRAIPTPANSALWKAPSQTPWLDGKMISYYPDHADENQAVDVDLAPGRHTLRARYYAAPNFCEVYAPRLLRQFAYVFGTSRDNGDFEGLDVTIFQPEGWDFVETPEAVGGTDGVKRTHFGKVLPDAFAFTFGKPLPARYYELSSVFFLVMILSILLPPILLTLVFVNQRRRGYVQPAAGFLWGLLWSALFGISAFLAAFGADYIYPVVTNGYGGFFLFLLIILFCAAIYLTFSLTWLMFASVMNKRNRAK
jgi:hypothetical protein